MSSSVLATEVDDLRTLNHVLIAGAVLLGYEYMITLGDEVEHVWSCAKKAVSLMFVGLRYPALVMQLLLVAFNMSSYPSVQSCAAMYYSAQAMSFMTISCSCGIFILRTYAIWDHNLILLGALSLIGTAQVLVNTVPNFVVPTFASGDSVELSGCSALGPVVLSTNLTTAQYALNILFDTLVLCLTIGRTFGVALDFRRLRMKSGVGSLLLRDGIIYFIANDALMVSVVALNQYQSEWTPTTLIVGLQLPLSSILAQRLVLSARNFSSNDAPKEPDEVWLPTVEPAAQHTSVDNGGVVHVPSPEGLYRRITP